MTIIDQTRRRFNLFKHLSIHCNQAYDPNLLICQSQLFDFEDCNLSAQRVQTGLMDHKFLRRTKIAHFSDHLGSDSVQCCQPCSWFQYLWSLGHNSQYGWCHYTMVLTLMLFWRPDANCFINYSVRNNCRHSSSKARRFDLNLVCYTFFRRIYWCVWNHRIELTL